MLRVEALPVPRIPETYQTAATQTAETKPRLTAEQIFLKPDNVYLSELGGDIQAIIGYKEQLNDPKNGTSEERRGNIELEIEKLVRKVNESGLDISTIPPEELKPQFYTVVATRTADEEGPLKKELELELNKGGRKLKRTLRNLVRKIVAPPKKAIEKVNRLKRAKPQTQS